MDHIEKYEEDMLQSYEDGEWTSAKELDRLKKYYTHQTNINNIMIEKLS